MNEFPYLLVRASHVLGTLLAVASLLDAEPRQVYRWIAGLELPTAERIVELSARLQSIL
jgi:hypothetical protein